MQILFAVYPFSLVTPMTPWTSRVPESAVTPYGIQRAKERFGRTDRTIETRRIVITQKHTRTPHKTRLSMLQVVRFITYMIIHA